MIDQASELRELVRNAAAGSAASRAVRPKWITVSGGKGGVGTTTLAVNLAVLLARRYGPTLLVDADPDRGDAAVLCGLAPGATMADVLAGKCSLEDALQPGPGGIDVLAGAPVAGSSPDAHAMMTQRLVRPLATFGERFEYLVIDGGNGSGPRARQMWHEADLVLLVTTPELPAVMDAYASVKLLTDARFRARIHTVVNMASEPAAACEVHGRLARTCQRFLGLHLETAGHVPGDERVRASTEAGCPLAVEEDAAALQSIVRLARTVASSVAMGPVRIAAAG